MNDPILSEAVPHVAPLPAMTKPFGTTILQEPVYFRSAMSHVNLIRGDGKKLNFMNHFFKTVVAEDIKYIREHFIDADVPGVEECKDLGAVAAADQALDPKGAAERAARAKILAELAAAGINVELTADGKFAVSGVLEVAKQAAEEVATKAQGQIDQIVAGQAGAAAIAGTDAVTAAKAKLDALRAAKTDQNGAQISNPLNPGAVPLLTPVSTSDIAGAAAGSTSTTDAS